jgi:Putative peptidoglycan binding domain
MNKIINKVSISVVSIATVLSLSGAAAVLPVTVHGAALSDAQVSAIISLLESFGADAATVANVQASLSGEAPVIVSSPSSSSVPASLLASSDLTLGSKGAAVKDLQIFLNAAGHTVAASGVGSAGNESEYFGNLTKTALAKFQAAEGISPASGYFGSISRAKLKVMSEAAGSTTPEVVDPEVVIPSGSNMAIALAPTTVVALIQSQSIGVLANFSFTNTTAVASIVKTIVLKRTGVSNDSALSNVYLYEGTKRISDAASVSDSIINFNTPSGIFTVPAGSSKIITVRADIAGSTSGQIVGVTLNEVTADIAVSGTPVAGPMQTIASATLATADFNTSTTPSAASIDPQDDYIMWQNTVSVATRALDMESISFREIGSINYSDLSNFKLFVDGVQVGSMVSSLDSNGYVSFDMSASPVELKTGNRVIKLVGNIIGGSNRNFLFSLRQVADVMLLDSQLNQPILPTSASATFTAREAGQQDINSGTLSILKRSDSISGNVTNESSGITLAAFDVKAAGERMKVENLRLGIIAGTATVGSLRNAAVFVDGVQVGSTKTIATSTSASEYTEFTLSSSLIVEPGTPRLLEIRADIYDNDGTNSIVNGTTLQAAIRVGSGNVQRMTSLSYTANTQVLGNSLTVASGSLTASRNAAYGTQTTVVPRSAFKIASFNLIAGDSEGMNLNTISLGIRQNGTTDALITDMSDIYAVYGSTTATSKPSVAATSTWSITKALAANENISVNFYANLNTGILSGSTTVTTLYINGTTANSAQSKNTGYIAGQTVNIAAGSITASFVDDSAVAERILVGDTSSNKIASFKFVAINDSYTITDLGLKVADLNAAGSYIGLVLKSSGMSDVNIAPFNGLISTTSSLSIVVPANESAGKVIDVYATTNSVGSGAATSSYATVGITLEGYKYENAAGVSGAYTDVTTNAMYLSKSIPTISSNEVTGRLLAGTSKSIASFTISADAKGAIDWKKIVLSVNKTAAITVGATSTMKLYDSNGDEVVGVFATTTGSLLGGLDALGGVLTSGKFVFVATTREAISAGDSMTYTLKSTIGGVSGNGQFLDIIVEDLASAHAAGNTYAAIAGTAGSSAVSFVWSDNSVNLSDESTADWFNDYKIKNLSSDVLAGSLLSSGY